VRSATKKKTGKDKAYLDWIRSLPCVLCFRHSYSSGDVWQYPGDFARYRRAEAAHVGTRGLSQKSLDRQAIPLCIEHHRTGKASAHVLGKKFWTFWGIDKDELIAELNNRYEQANSQTNR
jgi:hypothetical protein